MKEHMHKGVIHIIDGMLKGGEYKVDASLTIGRNPDNNLQLLSMRASRFHAVVERRDGEYWLRDLGSTSGTLVNGKIITQQQLMHGDQIDIGETTLSFRLDSPASASPLQHRQVTHISFDSPEKFGATAELKMTEIRGLPQLNTTQQGSQLGKLVERYRTLHQANQLISSEAPLETIYNKILQHLFNVVPADRGIIMVRRAADQELELMVAKARNPEMDISHIRVSKTIVSKAMDERLAVMTCDAMQDFQYDRQSSIHAQNIRSAICVPLLFHDDEVLGVIYLDTLNIIRPFDQEMLELVTAVAGPAAIAIKNATYIDELKANAEEIRHGYLSTINVLTRSIEARDKYTIGHAWRVTRFAMELANALDWSAERMEVLEMGAVLHDVGKVGIRDAVLCKRGRLDEEEYTMMRQHPEIGARILKDVRFLQPALPCIRDHHERWDGRGYPNGISGEQISMEGRILAIADAFDAMTSNRVYRQGLPPETAVTELQKCSGQQFDSALVTVFVELYQAGKIDYVLQNKARQGDGHSVLCPSCSTYIELSQGALEQRRLYCPICKKELQILPEQSGFRVRLFTSTHPVVPVVAPGLATAKTDG